jgi:hypothetical protein
MDLSRKASVKAAITKGTVGKYVEQKPTTEQHRKDIERIKQETKTNRGSRLVFPKGGKGRTYKKSRSSRRRKTSKKSWFSGLFK